MKLYTPNTGQYNFVMAYPSDEKFALSSLGYLWLYKIADMYEGINAHRMSTDNIDIHNNNIDSIAFSLSFDFDYLGVLKILDKLRIPFYSNERVCDNSFPLIFAGGPVITTNPRPYEKFFDFLILGDGEEVFKKVLDVIVLKLSKSETLEKLAMLDGIYIPGIKSKRNITSLNNVIYTPELNEQSYFKNTFIIELTRGCMNRCAFCTASYINLPFRQYEYEKIISAIELGLKYTNNIALLGAQISAHSNFDSIMNYIEQKIDSGVQIELGISSLRADAVSPNMIRTLVKGGQKHSTIAIEAASERLRKYINKNLSEEQILNAVNISRENGLKGLKIYSMIGIPQETNDDIADFLKLAEKIKHANKGFNIEFSFSTFVPKPQTPFQWSKRENTKSLEKKQKFLEKELAKLGISSKFSSAKWDYWQTILSRSDESIAPLLVNIYNNGGNIGAYKKVFKEYNTGILKAIEGYSLDEVLPWDIIESYPPKQQLINEFNRLSKFL